MASGAQQSGRIYPHAEEPLVIQQDRPVSTLVWTFSQFRNFLKSR